MDLLFLAHRAPFPPDRGDKIRSYHVLRYLTARARVHLIAFGESESDFEPPADLAEALASITLLRRTKPQALAAVEALAKGLPVSLTAFASPAMARAVAARRCDAVYCFSGQMAQYLPAGVPAVMDFVDVDSAKFAGFAADGPAPMRWMMRREARRLGAFERRVARDVRASLFVSEAEAGLFRAGGGSGRIAAVENGIDAATFDPALCIDGPAGRARPGPIDVQRPSLSTAAPDLIQDPASFGPKTTQDSDSAVGVTRQERDVADRAEPWIPAQVRGDGARGAGAGTFAAPSAGGEGPLVVFTGQMDYRPNVEAVGWFTGEVLPRLRATHPSVRFAIVGRAPTPAVRALAGSDVIVTGAVDDVRPWLAAAAVCVAPLRLARGIQNKVLEAMAMARPVVASPAAAEGIDHGGTLRVADSAADQAAAIGALLDDPPAAAALGAAARAQVLARYDWAARLAPLDALLGLAA